LRATFNGLTKVSGRCGSQYEYKNPTQGFVSKGVAGVIACPQASVKLGFSARNCLHCPSGSVSVIRGQSAIWPRIQVVCRLA
jgi:hypothetical protein